MPIGSKIIKGVLGRLTGDTPTKVVSDEEPKAGMSRRGVLQGLAAAPVAGALGEIPAGKLIEDIAPVAKKVIPKLPEDFSDLSSYKNVMDMVHMRVGLDEVNNRFPKELKEMGIADPDKITDDDLIRIGEMVEEDSSFPMSTTELFSMDAENINRWLNDEIPLDQVDTGEDPIVSPLLKQLQEVYQLDKKQIRDYLIKNEILEE